MDYIKNVCVIICAAFLLCTGVLSGCGTPEEEYGYKLFYINEDENKLEPEGYNAYSKDDYSLIGELLAALATKPISNDVMTPGFDSMSVLNYNDVSQEGYVTVNFNAGYNSLPPMKEILCRAAIVKTLCQIESVKGVEFMVEGVPCVNPGGIEYGVMSEQTFVDNSGGAAYRQTLNVSLYFASNSGNKLIMLPVSVTFDGTISMEQLVVQQLIRGPQAISGLDRELKAVIPETTVVNQITVREQICYIDLSSDFLTALPGISREAALYSVVNSLVELPGINKVQFSIDGNILGYFGDSLIAFDKPLERNLEIVKE